jgi:hypothetical protein
MGNDVKRKRGDTLLMRELRDQPAGGPGVMNSNDKALALITAALLVSCIIVGTMIWDYEKTELRLQYECIEKAREGK